MDNLQINEEISALQKIREEYELQLKLIGFELCDIGDDHSTLLNEYAEIKSTTKLQEINNSYLEELCYTEQREQIEYFVITTKLKNDIMDLEKNIEIENSEIGDLENFSSFVNHRIESSTRMENAQKIEQKIEGIQKIQNNISIPKDLNIDDLIAKVEILEKKIKSEKIK